MRAQAECGNTHRVPKSSSITRLHNDAFLNNVDGSITFRNCAEKMVICAPVLDGPKQVRIYIVHYTSFHKKGRDPD